MGIEETTRVVEVRGGTQGLAWETEDVNEYLKLSWRLVSVYIEDRGETGVPNGRPCYVLAWSDTSREPVFPRSYIEKQKRLDQLNRMVKK